VKLTTHCHLAFSLRLSGAIPFFPLYSLMARIGAMLHCMLAGVNQFECIDPIQT